jgi:hypothetical protein
MRSSMEHTVYQDAFATHANFFTEIHFYNHETISKVSHFTAFDTLKVLYSVLRCDILGIGLYWVSQKKTNAENALIL